jgi:hypothetical protein
MNSMRPWASRFDEFLLEVDEVARGEFLAVVLAGLQEGFDGVERGSGEGGGGLGEIAGEGC